MIKVQHDISLMDRWADGEDYLDIRRYTEAMWEDIFKELDYAPPT